MSLVNNQFNCTKVLIGTISFFVVLSSIIFYSIFSYDIKRSWNEVKTLEFVVDSVNQTKKKVYITYLDYGEKTNLDFDNWNCSTPATKGTQYTKPYNQDCFGLIVYVFIIMVGMSTSIMTLIVYNIITKPYYCYYMANKRNKKEHIVKGAIG